MKNIHVLPTDKPSKIGKFLDTNSLILRSDKDIPRGENVNIYITSDEEDINENDSIVTADGRLVKVSYLLSKDLEGASKVILTTDPNLIEDGVQSIDDEFLQWFCSKNGQINFVEVKRLEDGQYVDRLPDGSVIEGIYENYEAIIPQEKPKQKKWDKLNKELDDALEEEFGSEEPKQEYVKCTCANSLEYSNCGKKCERILDEQEPKQETLEEVAEIFKNDRVAHGNDITYENGFVDGAKSDAAKDYWFKIFKENTLTR